MRYRRNAQTDRERAADPSTPPGDLAKLARHYPAEVAGNPNADASTLIDLSATHPAEVTSNPGFQLLAMADPSVTSRVLTKYRGVESGVPYSTQDVLNKCEGLFKHWGASFFGEDRKDELVSAIFLLNFANGFYKNYDDEEGVPEDVSFEDARRAWELLKSVANNVGCKLRRERLDPSLDERCVIEVDTLFWCAEDIVDEMFGRDQDWYGNVTYKRREPLAMACTKFVMNHAIMCLLPMDQYTVGPATLAFCNRYCDHRIFGKYRNNPRNGW